MAYSSITTTFAGPGNQGLQVGHNSGSIETHIHTPAERPETPPQPSCFVPFRRDPDFVDRGTLLDQIREQCSMPASRIALVGLGGVGKSQLAIEHCYRTAQQSPETWVFWAHASNIARLEQSYREIADQVKVRGRKDPQADVIKLVHDWLRNEKNGPWLLVLDNADDAAVLSPPPSNSQKLPADNGGNGSSGALPQHLSKYLPPSRHGSVLVTSRTKHAAMQVVDDRDIIPIEPMHDAAAHALLHKKLGDTGDKDDGIAKLATALEHIPLALVQAAAYIRKRAPRCSVQQYLEAYYQSDSRKTSLLNQEAGHLRRDEAASNSILITWQISFDYIQSTRRSAADLLSLMSFFDRQGIQEALLRSQDSTANERVPTGRVNDEFEDDVLILRDYSFITVTKNANTFEMHNLVQLATRKWLEDQGLLDKWREQFISNLCAELPTGQHENWQKCQALFPHARAALAQRPKDRESLKEWALLLYKAAWYAWERGRADEAEQMSMTSAEVRRDVFGEENAETLSSMAMVGRAMNLGGRWKEAELINRQTLVQREKVLGLEHPDTLMSMSSLAGVLGNQGKYKEAESITRQTLAWREKILGPEHPDILSSISDLAGVLYRQGKYKEAESIYRQILVQEEKVLGLEHPNTLTSISNLALVLNHQGKYKEAESMTRQTLARIEKILGPEHPVILTIMSNLAVVLYQQGKYKEAESIYRQILVQEEKILGPEHPSILISISNLAGILNRQGKHKEAESIYRQILVQWEKVVGPEHPSALMSMGNLATALGNQGKYKEAESITRQTLAWREKILGPEHPETLNSIYYLAYLLSIRCCYDESLALYERAYATYHTILGKDHPTTRDCRQYYTEAKMHATEEQGRSTLSTTKLDSGERIHTGKLSELVRRLAKIGIRSSKTSINVTPTSAGGLPDHHRPGYGHVPDPI